MHCQVIYLNTLHYFLVQLQIVEYEINSRIPAKVTSRCDTLPPYILCLMFILYSIFLALCSSFNIVVDTEKCLFEMMLPSKMCFSYGHYVYNLKSLCFCVV